ncbi:MAG: phosphate acyltransferase [Armatimonadetes bacterium]|nr:phosphate acyltransferase [Armatimonadota bacterium]
MREARPDLMVDGEMMADVALSPELRAEDYPFSALVGEANVLVFPSLEAANVAYKLVQRLGGAVAVGPILMGISKPVHVLSRGAEVNDVVKHGSHCGGGRANSPPSGRGSGPARRLWLTATPSCAWPAPRRCWWRPLPAPTPRVR